MATRVTFPLFKAFTADCTFGVGYKLYTYEAGTSTLLTTYQDKDATTPHTNPIILDSLGEKEIFINQAAKFTLTDADDNVQTNWPVDNISPFSVTAAEVSYVPSGDLTSTNVQDALDEIVVLVEDLQENDVPPSIDLPTGVVMEGNIAGLFTTHNTTDSDHDIDISAGACLDSTGAIAGQNASSMTKQIDADWAAGNDAGGLLDNATEGGADVAANTMYYLYALIRDADGVIDFGWVAKARDIDDYLPTGYSYYRLLRHYWTDSSSNLVNSVMSGDTIYFDPDDVPAAATSLDAETATNIDLSAQIPENAIAYKLAVSFDVADETASFTDRADEDKPWDGQWYHTVRDTSSSGYSLGEGVNQGPLHWILQTDGLLRYANLARESSSTFSVNVPIVRIRR